MSAWTMVATASGNPRSVFTVWRFALCRSTVDNKHIWLISYQAFWEASLWCGEWYGGLFYPLSLSSSFGKRGKCICITNGSPASSGSYLRSRFRRPFLKRRRLWSRSSPPHTRRIRTASVRTINIGGGRRNIGWFSSSSVAPEKRIFIFACRRSSAT